MVLQRKNDEKSMLSNDQRDHKTKNPNKGFEQLTQKTNKLNYEKLWKWKNI